MTDFRDILMTPQEKEKHLCAAQWLRTQHTNPTNPLNSLLAEPTGQQAKDIRVYSCRAMARVVKAQGEPLRFLRSQDLPLLP